MQSRDQLYTCGRLVAGAGLNALFPFSLRSVRVYDFCNVMGFGAQGLGFDMLGLRAAFSGC